MKGLNPTFTFTRHPSYIASLLFANVIKFFCSYARKNYATVEIHPIKGLKQLLPSLNVIRTQGEIPTNGRFTWRWGLQIGEVTCGGSPHLSCKRDQINMRHYLDRRVTPPKRVSSPTWGPSPPCKQVLSHQPHHSPPTFTRIIL